MSTVGLIALGVTAYYLLSGKGSGSGGFLDMAGNVITSAKCGTVVGFDVSGYTKVWLVQTQNGQPQFNGPFPLPMPPYTLNCSNDVGQFQSSIYEINPQGNGPGNLITSTTLTVSA